MVTILKKQKNNKKSKQLVKSTKDLKIGKICDLKISAHVSKGVGIDESSYGFTILVPNVQVGDSVKAKIVVVTKKYAIGKLVKVVKAMASKNDPNIDGISKLEKTLNVGDLVDVTISKFGPKSVGIAEIVNSQNSYKFIIPNAKETVKGALPQTATVEISRIKANYGFAKIVNWHGQSQYIISPDVKTLKNDQNSVPVYDGVYQRHDSETSYKTQIAKKGSKLTLTLPTKINRYGKYMVIKIAQLGTLGGIVQEQKQHSSLVDSVMVFIKPALGAKSGDKVKIKMVTEFTNANKYNLAIAHAIAKIVQLNPISSQKKKLIIRANIRKMLKSGVHFGEKAVKCNPRMKNYVWLRKKGQNKNKPLLKKGRNIINVLKTRRCLDKALKQLSKYAAKRKTFLFVGTKRAVSGLISRAALFCKKAFFVNTRWLGGMLTNWQTIKKAIYKIRPILKEKQTILKEILEKRQSFKKLLTQKTVLLKKQSRLLIQKGRRLIKKVMHEIKNNKLKFTEKSQKLTTKRKELVEKSQLLIDTYYGILKKRKELILKSQNLKEKASLISNKYKQLYNQLTITRNKLREFKYLLLILQNIKQISIQQNQNLYTFNENDLKDFSITQFSTEFTIDTKDLKGFIPNPPKEILNKIVLFIQNNDNNSAYSILNNSANQVPQFGDCVIESNPHGMKTDNISHEIATENSKATLMLSKLLGKFSLFVPHIKKAIKALNTNVQEVESKLNDLKNAFSTIKDTILTYVNVKNKLIYELRRMKFTLRSERRIIQILKRKLKQISSEKRLMKFLPKLRYLPNPSNKRDQKVIAQTVEVLMKRVVDPKLKYPMDYIYNRKLLMLSKKLGAARKKKWQRLEKYFGGIANMTKMKEQQIRYNVAIIVGQREEMNAVRECQKLGIKTFQIVDTNCNPSFADHVIPANDDSRNSVKYVLTKFVTRIRLAQKIRMRLKKLTAKKVKKGVKKFKARR